MYLENNRFYYEQYFTTEALEKHHPKFRYEISNPVRRCSNVPADVEAGYLDCAALGITGPGSVYDHYQEGYTSQIEWNDVWFFSVEQDPNERAVSWRGKLTCDAWCFYTDSGGSFQNRCHWYVRFVERRGGEGQFDFGQQHLLVKNDNTPSAIATPIYVPHGTFSSSSDVDAICLHEN